MEAVKKKALLEAFGEKLSGPVRMYLESCTRCGLCMDSCHAYQSEPRVEHTPVGRAQNIRRLYERYFSPTGQLLAGLEEAVELTDDWMKKVYETAYTCTGCRRCMTVCPFGVDTQQIQGIAKHLLNTAGEAPMILDMLADMSVAKGQTIEDTKQDFAAAVRNLQAEVIEKWRSEGGDEVVPLDVQGARVLYVALAGKHSIISAAAIMNAAGEKWSLSYFEAVNFGAFVGNPAKTRDIAQRIIDEAQRLGVAEVAICECGTAYRVMKYMTGKHPFKVVSFVELIARYLQEGRIKIDKSKLEGRVTYHDPCQLARNGGVFDEPRLALAHLTDDFVELTPTREHNWCCGGGGGLVAMGEKDSRMALNKVKAEQVRASGARVLVTACENCHSQLHDLMEHYQMEVEVQYLSEVVADALVR
ncbi:MAG: (Fe-S)-binding protein [Pseudomonadota bacterium]